MNSGPHSPAAAQGPASLLLYAAATRGSFTFFMASSQDVGISLSWEDHFRAASHLRLVRAGSVCQVPSAWFTFLPGSLEGALWPFFNFSPVDADSPASPQRLQSKSCPTLRHHREYITSVRAELSVPLSGRTWDVCLEPSYSSCKC